jgi:hypothetical protein
MSALLTVLRPISITTAMRKATSAVETVAAYDPTKSYGEGEKCRSDVTHRIYESKKAGNAGHDPTLQANLAGATPWWQDIDPTNDWAMFDNDVSTQTIAPSPFTVVLEPGFFTSAQFFGLDADHITVTVRDKPGGAVVKEVTHELEASAPGDYDEYFWDDFEPETGFVLGDIDQYNKAQITVTLTRVAGGNVACGAMVVGDEIQLGRTLAQPKVKPRSFDSVTTDKFGKTSITRRRATSDLDVTALLDITEANKVLAAVQSLLGVPCAWKASDSTYYSGLRCFGLGSADLTYDVAPGKCLLSLTVQGIIQWQQ